MSWNVIFKRKLERNLKKLPIEVQALFQVLIQDLEASGPEQTSWRNYSKLGGNKYH